VADDQMSEITFQLNGSQTTVPVTSPTQTLLDFLRIDKGLCGTKDATKAIAVLAR